jgi:hypothetical protein
MPWMTAVAMKLSPASTKEKTTGFRVVAILLMFLVTAALLEIGSLGVYPLIFRKALSRADIQRRLAVEEPIPAAETKPARFESLFKNHILHPYVGFVANPGTYVSDWEFSRGGQTTTVNEQGFPGLDPILKRGSNVVNICILGGSFAMNLYLDSRDTLVNELRKNGSYQDKKINVTLAAMSGWKQPQQVLALTYLLSQGAEYNVVLTLDGFNEIALPISENVPAGVYPLYPRMWNVYASRTVLPDEALVRLSQLAVLRQKARERKYFFASSPFRYSNFCLLLFEVFDRRAQAQMAVINGTLQDVVNAGRQEHTPENSGPRRQFSRSDQILQESADSWERCSRQMDAMCRANGIAYFHFLQPNQYIPDSKPMGPAEKEVALFQSDNYGYKIAVQKGYPNLVLNGRKLERDGINFVDLTMLFKNVDEPVYEDDCCHVNKRGNDLIALKIAATIASSRPASPR